ncbi:MULTISPECIES: hypothetical protein [Sphingobacterium]|uniref:Uncharacterized protein n=1 Tax=Sphingobacterium hotanense TaxID=649196 RepID=A0ABT7NRL4_9SPHI|nr:MULTISPECIES: hypothetical protein [Sphingobacterium]MDM1049819.1 hypothetical protein [Sphingobacterium hotanense]
MEAKEEQIKEWMKSSTVKLPFQDFEDSVMNKIAEAEEQRARMDSSRKYALIFFAIGSLFGMASNYLIADFVEKSKLDVQLKSNIQLVSMLVYVVLILLFSDKIWKLKQSLKRQ